jgi:hypothetical protein
MGRHWPGATPLGALCPRLNPAGGRDHDNKLGGRAGTRHAHLPNFSANNARLRFQESSSAAFVLRAPRAVLVGVGHREAVHRPEGAEKVGAQKRCTDESQVPSGVMTAGRLVQGSSSIAGQRHSGYGLLVEHLIRRPSHPARAARRGPSL